MANVFISYKREERPLARKLADAFESAGLTVWWDPNLQAGQRFDDVIESAIVEADCVVVIWSGLSVSSNYVKDEASLALELGKLIPVSVDNTKAPLRFRNLHTFSLTRDEDSRVIPTSEIVAEVIKRLDATVQENRKGDRFKSQSTGDTVRSDIAGTWTGLMPGVKLAQSLTLVIPSGNAHQFEASMQVTYSVRELVFLVEETFAATIANSRLELRGTHVEYITPAKVREYFLDKLELTLSANRQCLVGTVQHSRGKHPVTLQREPRAGDA